jgi:glycosyltransferase involved in cell wall biosynthesis
MSDQPRAPVLALEISTMGERFHTGLANVTKALAREMLGDTGIEPHFFFSRQALPRALVERVVRTDGSEILWWAAARTALAVDFDYDPNRKTIGVYPGCKRHRRLFPTEVLIVHDLTTVITPQFHATEAIEWWQAHQLADILSSDLVVAVSESTRLDIRTYYPQASAIPCIAVPLASCCGPVAALPEGVSIRPYVLVLGTLEPRKDVEAVFRCLAEQQELLAQADFVFAGRWGWGPSAQELIARYHLGDAFAAGRIRFVGFVSDPVRDHLLGFARCVVYPSRYEGFGLPVVEALGLGTPVITSYSTSLPEVGGDVAIYCDTSSPEALAQALAQLLRARATDPAFVQAAKTWAASFTWSKTYQRIRDAALDVAAYTKSS